MLYVNNILDLAGKLKLDLLFFFLFDTLCYANLQRLKYTPTYCKLRCVSNDTPVQFSKRDLIKLFKDHIVRNCKSTAQPLGSLKLSLLRLRKSKTKSTTCKYCSIIPLVTIVMSIIFE